MKENNMGIGIYDTSNGQCTAAANIKGENFPCILAADHNGWAHQSRMAEAIWTSDGEIR